MKTTQKWTLGCLTLAVIMLFGGGALAFLLLVPAVEEQIPPGVSTFVVTLSTPLNDAKVPLNQFTTVTAEALGVKPITALELWIDGTPSETKNAPAGSSLNQFAASWTWTPASEGEHILFVRAVDASKSVGMSNVVLATASKDANAVPSAGYHAKSGDTAASVAQQAKISPQQIIDLNPQISPSGTITPGAVITVPIPPPPATTTPTPEPPPAPAPDPGASDPPGNPNKYELWGGSLWGQLFGVDPPATPSLTVSVGAGKCSIDLYIDDKSNNESGFYIYRLDTKVPNFKHIATLDAHSGPKPIHYVDPVSTGKYQYYVAAFNSAGKSASKIVKAAIIEPCGAPPGLGFSKGKVTVKQPVDNIYCYLSVDDGPWTRIPPGVNTFITPTKPGEFDVSQYLKSLTPSPPPPKITLHLECWGWKGDTLIYLGEATETISQGDVKIIAQEFLLEGFLVQNANGYFTDPNIARPLNAQMTVDPQECIKRAPPGPFSKIAFGILCASGANNGYQFLTWDWSPNGCPSGNCIKDIDGYHVYIQYIGNEPKLIDTINDRNQKVAILPPKSAPMFPPNFFARAFKGSSESEDSNQAQSKATQAKMTLPAESTAWRKIYQASPSDECLFSDPINIGLPPQGQIFAGFYHYYDDNKKCEKVNHFYRGAIWFDVSKIKGKIAEAKLQYRWTGGDLYNGPNFPTVSLPSCARTLMLGAEDWRGKDYGNQPVQIPGVDYMDLGWVIVKPGIDTLEFDVTSAVKQWSLGTPNYGFVFRGYDESLPATNNGCYSYYADFALKVTYQPTGQ